MSEGLTIVYEGLAVEYETLRNMVSITVDSLSKETLKPEYAGRTAAITACCELERLMDVQLTSWRARLEMAHKAMKIVEKLAVYTIQPSMDHERFAVIRVRRAADHFIDYAVEFAAELAGLLDDEQSGAS